MDEKLKEILPIYNEGLHLYREKKFKEAIVKFQEAIRIRPEDGPSKLYLERCEHLISNPPAADWDGVFVMTTK